jgi:hypothetical protein
LKLLSLFLLGACANTALDTLPGEPGPALPFDEDSQDPYIEPPTPVIVEDYDVVFDPKTRVRVGFPIRLLPDITGDGIGDIRVEASDGACEIWAGPWPGTFHVTLRPTGGCPNEDSVVPDVSGDGRPELQVGNFWEGLGLVFGPVSAGSDLEPDVFFGADGGGLPYVSSLAIGEFNGDESRDLWVFASAEAEEGCIAERPSALFLGPVQRGLFSLDEADIRVSPAEGHRCVGHVTLVAGPDDASEVVASLRGSEQLRLRGPLNADSSTDFGVQSEHALSTPYLVFRAIRQGEDGLIWRDHSDSSWLSLEADGPAILMDSETNTEQRRVLHAVAANPNWWLWQEVDQRPNAWPTAYRLFITGHEDTPLFEKSLGQFDQVPDAATSAADVDGDGTLDVAVGWMVWLSSLR